MSGAEKLCMNGCNSPADPHFFGFSVSEMECSIDEQCNFLEDKINSKLPPNYQLTFDINSKNEDNFGKVFCNINDNKCSFAAGYVNSIGKNHYGDGGTNKYIIGEYSDDEEKTCGVTANDKSGPEFNINSFKATADYKTGSDILGCKLKGGKDLIWGFSSESESIKESEYITGKKFTLDNSSNNFDCLFATKNINSVFSTEGSSYKNLNNNSGVSANSENISLSENQICNISADCKNLKYSADVCKDSSCTESKTDFIKWPIYTDESISEHKFPTHGFFVSPGKKQDIIFNLNTINQNFTDGTNNICYYNPQSYCETWPNTAGTVGAAQKYIKQQASNIEFSSFQNPCRYSPTTNGCYPNESANSNLVLDEKEGKVYLNNQTYDINTGDLKNN